MRTLCRYIGLQYKGGNYYFRGTIPKVYWPITRCKEIAYSLHTSYKELAIKRWYSATYHFQQFLNTFEEVFMEINTNEQLILTPDDVDKVLFYELERKKRMIETKSVDIEKGIFASKDIELYPESTSVEEKNKIIVSLIKEYLQCLYQKKELHITIQDIYKGVYKDEVFIGITEGKL